jgi:hypothetical protein
MNQNTDKNRIQNENCILKSIQELSGLHFYIPSYQRGYRWEKSQIEDLLNDFLEYDEKVMDREDEDQRRSICKFYCLQPLVVKEKTWGNVQGYEVIDGQQRLTTIYLILTCLKRYFEQYKIDYTLFTLDYETRPGCKSFFDSGKFKIVDNSNIDYMYISLGYKYIREWFDQDMSGREQAINNIFTAKDTTKKTKYKACFIWYPIDKTENPYKVFSRLNSGKISLSDAELTKALILNKNNPNSGTFTFNQTAISDEWNDIENTLHDDLFWNFINPNPEGYEATRIDYLLEIATRCDQKERYVKTKEENTYPAFSYFSKLIGNGERWNDAWQKIREIFRTMKTWYADRELYHYIGYLINQKGNNIQQKFNLLCGTNSDTFKNNKFYQKGMIEVYKQINKNDFLGRVKDACKKTLITDEKKPFKMDLLYYPKNNDEIHNVLLLFNLATIQNQVSENARYPFDLHHTSAITSKWSLEHIHAQNERLRKWTSDEVSNLKKIIENMPVDTQADSQNLRIQLCNYLSEATLNDEKTAENTNKAVIGLFMGEQIKSITDADTHTIVFTSEFEKDDSLKNMALLQGDKNAAFSNKLYPEKRQKLADYENAEKQTFFVPICTRNVFFKHYSPNAMNPYIWDRQAGKEYAKAIVNVVANFIGAKAYFSDADDRLEYGLWWNEETADTNQNSVNDEED